MDSWPIGIIFYHLITGKDHPYKPDKKEKKDKDPEEEKKEDKK